MEVVKLVRVVKVVEVVKIAAVVKVTFLCLLRRALHNSMCTLENRRNILKFCCI